MSLGLSSKLRALPPFVTAAVLQNQIRTIERLLHHLPSATASIRIVWPFWLMLVVAVFMLGRFLRRIQKVGLAHYKLEEQALIAARFRDLSATVRRLTARGDIVGLGEHFAFKPFFRKLSGDARKLLNLAGQLETIDGRS